MARVMKDSGVEWVGLIPDTWKVLRNKNCFQLEKKIVGDDFEKCDLLSLTKRGITQKDIENSFGKTPESYSTYQSVRSGQMVMCLFDLDVSAVFSGLSGYDGMISPAYKIYSCNPKMLNRYAKYWFEYCFDGRKYKIYSKSLRYVVNADDFGCIEILVPPIDEQKKIANYLDKIIKELDTIIFKTRESIEEYKKYKAVIIDEAINNEKCSKYKFRYLGELKNGLNYHDVSDNRKIKFLGVGDFKDYMILSGAEFFSDLSIDEDISEEYLLKSGDIVFVRSNGSKELVGRSIMVENVNFDLTYSGFCIRFRNLRIDLVDNKYLLYFFRSEYFKELLKLGSVGANINNLSQDILNAVRVPIPSKIRQQEIIDYLDKKCGEIDTLIAKKEAFVEEMEAYKKSLIYEYVTGKKEVPGY